MVVAYKNILVKLLCKKTIYIRNLGVLKTCKVIRLVTVACGCPPSRAYVATQQPGRSP